MVISNTVRGQSSDHAFGVDTGVVRLSRDLSAIMVVAFLACSMVTDVAQAANQLVQIDEVLVGANGNSRVQFIELKMADASQNQWGPQSGESAGRARLVFFDATGEQVGEFVFPSDPAVGPEEPDHGGFSVLVGTLRFAALVDMPAPDFIIPPSLIADSGKVCFKNNPANTDADEVNLCFSYGNFDGDTEEDTDGQSAGVPAQASLITGVVSLQRIENFENYGAGQFNADFAYASPAPRNSAGRLGSLVSLSLTDQGEALFSQETFLGNGRTCMTCHRRELAFGLSPELIALLPDDEPLFVAATNPDLTDLENTCLLAGPRGLNLENIDGFENPPMFRGAPHLLNIALTAPYSLSAAVEDLRAFSTGAVMQHLPRTLARNADPEVGAMDFRLPTDEELDAMEDFMQSIMMPRDGNLDLDRMIDAAVDRGADQAQIDSGRDLFFGDTGSAKCILCHGGPSLSDADKDLGEGNVSFNTGVVNLAINDFADCLEGPLPEEDSGDREFSTPPLVGVALTAPFFHDNSVETLDEAVDFYNSAEFANSPASALIGGISMSAGEVDDVVAFLEALVEPVDRVSNLTQGTTFGTIQEALDGAADGEEIEVEQGVYSETIDFLGKDILLRSTDPMDPQVVAATIIDGGQLESCVQLSAGTITGFTIRNGRNTAFRAGGVHATGTAIVSHNVISGNVADNVGGGVTAEDTVLVHNNRIILNSAGNRGGGINARDDSLVFNNYIAYNSAEAGGGAIRVRENTTIRNNTIAFNGSAETGVGILGGGGVLAEDASTLTSNIIAFSFDGSGLHIEDDTGVVADFNCVFGNAGGEYSGIASAGANDVNADPRLDLDNMHLATGSPCFNAGPVDFVALPDELDVDGENRVMTGRVDIGADELDQPISDCNENGIEDSLDLFTGSSDDCNANGVPDECDLTTVFSVASGELAPIGDGFSQDLTLVLAPVADGDVELTFTASADLDAAAELINVDINGVTIGTIFDTEGSLCSTGPDVDSLTVSAATYNSAVDGGTVVINMVASSVVNADLCPDGFITVSITYIGAGDPVAADCNENAIPDECDLAEGTSQDTNSNNIPDECEDLPVHNLTQRISFSDIQSAIDAAVDGDEIEVDPGNYAESLDFLDKDIIIRSTDPFDADVVADTIIDGGGLDTAVTLSAGVISGFTITGGGQSGADAGGVQATGTAVVRHNVITGNAADEDGGGVIARDTATVHNNHIVANSAVELGGGVSAHDNSVIVDNFIAFNSAEFGGGGLRTRETPTIRNNTIVFNSSADAGPDLVAGGGILAAGSPVITNNVIAFSTDGTGLHVFVGESPAADFNCVFGNLDGDYSGDAVAGPNDLNIDPELEADDLHLANSSPCADAGDPDLDPLPDETDIDGEARIQNDRVDIGADESAPSACEGDANGDGTVDPLDGGFILARFGCPVGTGQTDCDAADVNGDGAVDPLDSGFVLARFGECN